MYVSCRVLLCRNPSRSSGDDDKDVTEGGPKQNQLQPGVVSPVREDWRRGSEWGGREGRGANANVSLLDVCGVKGGIQKRFSEGWRNGRLAALCLDGARSAKGGELYVLWVEGGVRRRNHCRDGVLSTGLQIQPQSGRREPLSVWKGGAFFCNRREENAPDWSGGSLLM